MAIGQPKIAIVYYSLYGHVRTLAESIQKGIEAAGGNADLYQVAETLPEDVLTKMSAPPKSADPVITPEILKKYDAFVFGVSGRYGTQSAQWRTFWDQTGGVWHEAGLHGKYAGAFVSTGSLGGGQETSLFTLLTTLVHHGIIFVPLGYKGTFKLLTNVEEVHGGSAWGAGTIAGDGPRQPSELELKVANIQGQEFFQHVKAVDFGSH